MRAAPMDATDPVETTCRHCGTPLARGERAFCCTGCEAVFALLASAGLSRFHELRDTSIAPARVPDERPRDRPWLAAYEAELVGATGLVRLTFDVQGLSCAACVWLIEELFRRKKGGARALVNPSLGRVELTVRSEFPLRAFVDELSRFGYRLGPPLKDDRAASHDLLWRMGLCVALAMNSMIFALPLYFGLAEGPMFTLFQRITLGLSAVAFVVGGSVFFRSAWQSVRRSVLHLDLPIALGIVLAFAGSLHSFFFRHGRGAYFDTLNVFIALMLVGRFLQERVIEKNRRFLLASDGAEGLLTRRVEQGRVEVVKCTRLREGDTLVLSPGDLVPVDAVLEGTSAHGSLDWINGESTPRLFHPGEVLPAGAFLAGECTVTLRAAGDFSGSPLVELLRAPIEREADADRLGPWWQRLTKAYVLAVLLAAALAFALWYGATGSLGRSLDVVTAVLVVTCPCAFGIAAPLAYELAQAGLRRAGLYVRTRGFLDRAADVTRVVFDKTGTLTTGALTVERSDGLDTLTDDEHRVLYNLVARSHHPKSVAVRRLLEREWNAHSAEFQAALCVAEDAGKGLEVTVAGHAYRLGDEVWTSAGASASDEADVVFARDGAALTRFFLSETLRDDAREECSRLARDGQEVVILSGDTKARVERVARSVGVPTERAVAALSPGEKAAWLALRDRRDTLMVGDGINDSLVVEKAFCSGTPAIDRPFMAARSDFYFVTPGLGPIRLALSVAKAVRSTVRRNLILAVAYNVFAVAFSYAGLMSPVLCATLMPLSSLSTLLLTMAALSGRSSLWRS